MKTSQSTLRTGINFNSSAEKPFGGRTTMYKTPNNNTNIWWSEGIGP
jgi:hypothetical protein